MRDRAILGVVYTVWVYLAVVIVMAFTEVLLRPIALLLYRPAGPAATHRRGKSWGSVYTAWPEGVG